MNAQLTAALAEAANFATWLKQLPADEFEKVDLWNAPPYVAVYKAVRTWEDLLITNLAFLHDKFIPFYYGAFLGSEDAGHRASIQNLIDLHLYGLFTHDGQGNTCLYGEGGDEEQRPYVTATVPRAMWPKIKVQLDKFKGILHYKAFACDSNTTIDISLTDADYADTRMRRGELLRVFTLTRGRDKSSEPWVSNTDMVYGRNELNCLFHTDAENYPRIQHMLKNDGFEVEVVMREFCSPKLADAILLECVKRAGFRPRLKDPYRDMKVDAATRLQALARQRAAKRRVATMRAPSALPPSAPAPAPVLAPASSLPVGHITPGTVALFAYLLDQQKKSTRRRRSRSRRRSRRSRRLKHL